VLTLLSLPLTSIVLDAAVARMGLTLLSGKDASCSDDCQRPTPSAVKDYFSRTMVTGPSFVSATSIIAPKEPVLTDLTPTSRSFSQK
jgi:hypothetical protein